MNKILSISAVTVALFTTLSAHAAFTEPVRGVSKPGPRLSEERTQLALWKYCGLYTRPDGSTGIKCYDL